MVDFVVTQIFDLVAFAMSVVAVVVYQLYLRWRTLHDPASSALSGMHAARAAWVTCVMTEQRDILAVQTLRNSIMTASFLASAAVLLIIGVLTLSAQGDKLSGTWLALNVFGHVGAGLWLFKLLMLLFDLLFAFFAFCLSMRSHHHISYLINVPASSELEATQPTHVTAELNRAAIYFRVGIRAYFFIVPLLFWLFGPLWMAGATAMLIFFLYHLDRMPKFESDLMG
jgi:uncharacterized membrane protein